MKDEINTAFDFSSLSRWRTTLMGIAILGVLILHTIGLGQLDLGLSFKPLELFSNTVFTEGFLLLSGLGLYYSFSRDNDLRRFYKRRVLRLLIPFMVISSPYFLYQYVTGESSFVAFLMNISSLSFWTEGNYCGMWYVAISVLLYLTYPILHKITSGGGGNCVLLLILCMATIVTTLGVMNPSYYNKVEIGITKIPMFILGIYLGKLSIEAKKISVVKMGIGLFIFLILAKMLKGYFTGCSVVYNCAYRLFGIFVWCMLLPLISRTNTGEKAISILNWFGKYTLELYVLHLLIYCFFNGLDYNLTPIVCIGSAVLLSVLFCMPVHKGVQYVINMFKGEKAW